MLLRIGSALVLTGLFFTMAILTGERQPTELPTLDDPSPALGKAVATAVHQALTDPYFAPLERLALWMEANPTRESITVDLLSKWAPDDEFPTCFVWNTDGSRLQFDHPIDPAAVELLVQRLREGLAKPNPTQLLFVSSFRVEGERYWLGFVGVPAGSPYPAQIAGAFFSIREYLNLHVRRLIDDMATRPRFPLFEFQSSDPSSGRKRGDLSIRILDKEGEVFYQFGSTFDEAKLIYAESQFFPKPIVALQEGWDVQVFSSNVQPVEKTGIPPLLRWGLPALGSLLAAGALFLVGRK